MNERYDLAIIGSGPAGLSAALNAKIRKKKFIIFGSNEISGKLAKAEKINNYLGFYGKSGSEVRDEFKKHLESMDISITEEKINNIYAMGDYYSLMANDKVYEATAVILATGVNFGKPFKGEEEVKNLSMVIEKAKLSAEGNEEPGAFPSQLIFISIIVMLPLLIFKFRIR